MRITLSYLDLAAANLATSKEQTRYYLNGVFIDAVGFMVATDGHRLFYAECPDAKQLAGVSANREVHSYTRYGIIIPKETIAAVGKAKPGPTVDLVQREDAGWQIEVQGGAAFGFKPIDGDFPDWTRILPSAEQSGEPAHFNPTYVADLGKTAKLLGLDISSFHIHHTGNNPTPVTFGSREDCAVVIMPMRSNGHRWSYPAALGRNNLKLSLR